MLKKLTIRNYALIEHLDIEFPAGLVIITGETGAGKSILLGALSLLLGARADLSVLKDRTSNCVVEGIFEADAELLSGMEADPFSGAGSDSVPVRELILRRVITPGGRSRSFLNDEPVSNSALSGISSRLVDIHAQHQHLLLTDASFQLSVLDHFAGTVPLLKEYREAHAALSAARTSLRTLDEEAARLKLEADYKQFQFDKLEEAALKEGEWELLESEQKQLAHAGQIKESLYGAAALLQPMGVSVVQNLKEASQILRKCSNFAPVLSELSERLDACRIECKDIEEELDRTAGGITVSPQRLEQVEERMGKLDDLMRKFGCSTVGELIAAKGKLEEELLQAEAFEDRRGVLAERVSRLEQLRAELAQRLSEIRKEKVEKLGKTLEERIRELEMPRAVFRVELQASEEYTSFGRDIIRFLFSANGSEHPNDLAKAASGGELSRIMLCLKALMAGYTGMPTLIFDEIDTGVSGSIADKMGRLIGALGKNMQVFAITHLPQIATKGDTHLLVYKEFGADGEARTDLRKLDGEERVKEIARMLSGAELTDAAMENARVLLDDK